MSLKSVFAAVLFAASMAAVSSARADQYRPEEFFSLDLKKAVLSPKPLGPPAQFEQVRVEAKTDFQSRPVRSDIERSRLEGVFIPGRPPRALRLKQTVDLSLDSGQFRLGPCGSYA